MRAEHRAILYSVVAAVLVWLANALVDFHLLPDQTLPGALLLALSPHELVMRLITTVAIVAAGLIAWSLVRRSRREREDAARVRDWLAVTLNSIGDAVIATDREGRVLFMNPVAEKLTGWDESEAHGRPLEAVFVIENEDTGEKVESPVARVLREGTVVGLANHTVMVGRDGSRRPIDDSGAPIRDARGAVIGTVLVFADVSERRYSERRIARLNSVLRAIRNVNQLITRENEEAALIQGACDCLTEARGYLSAVIVLFDAQDNLARVAASGLDAALDSFEEQMHGGKLPVCWKRVRSDRHGLVTSDPDSDCPGCTLADAYPPDATINTIRLQHGGRSFGFLSVCSPHTITMDDDELELFREVAGDIAFALYSIRESQARQDAEERELKTLHMLRSSVEHMLEAYALHEAIFDGSGRMCDYRFVDLNPAGEQIIGRPREEIIGRTALELFPHVKERGLLDKYADVMATGQRTVIEDIYYDGDNLNKFFMISCFRLDEKHFVCVFRDSTARVKALRDAQRAQRELLAALDHLPAGVLVADAPDVRIRIANSAALGIRGGNSHSLTDIPVELHPQKWQTYYLDGTPYKGEDLPLSRAILKGEVVTNEEVIIRRVDGIDRLVSASAAPIRDGDGRIVGGIVVFPDITEHREAERRLHIYEERIRGFLESVNDMVYFQALDGSVSLLNEAAYRLSGYSEAEVRSDPLFWIKLVHPKDLVMIQEFFRERAGKEESWDANYRLRTRDGEWRWIQSRMVAARDKSGAIVGYNCVDRDITDQKRSQDALSESERRYQELFSSVIEGLGLVDESERIVFCNPAYAHILDERSVRDVVGKSLFDYVLPEDREFVKEQTLHRRKGESAQYEMKILSAAGTRKTVLVSVSPRYDESGDYLGAFAAVMDVTEQKRLQEFAVRAQRLETAGRIAGQVAHDFNNLLAPLMAYPSLIREMLPADHEARDYLDRIESASDQIADINQQLLTLGRRGHYSVEIVNLNQIVRQAQAQLPALPETLSVETHLADGLMNTKGGPAQILRVVSNLLSNALEAMHNVGRLTITTENYYVDEMAGKYGRVPKGEYVKLTVADTGGGIPHVVLNKIFEPFFTTKTTDRRRGSGLGLSVVHSVVEDHHGYIDFETELGKGTTFYVYLPVSREEEPAARADDEPLAGGSETVLVVDDDWIQRDVTITLLEKLGYRAMAVESGEDAIDFIRDHRCDLIVLDMIMPGGLDGTETYRKLLELHPDQRAIIVSGYAESERVQEALRLGAGAFVRKPLTLKSIGRAVRRELDRVRAVDR